LQEITQIRAGLATAIFLYALQFIISREWKKYIGCCLLAFGFHYSSIALIPLYFIFNTNSFNPYRYIIYLIVAILVGVFRINLIGILQILSSSLLSDKLLPYYDEYAGLGAVKVSLLNPFVLLNLLVAFYLIRSVINGIIVDAWQLLVTKVHIVSVGLYFFFISIPIVSFRLYELFNVVQIVSIPIMLSSFHEKLIPLIIITSICLIFLIIYASDDTLMPYKLFFQK
jgi:hypothetical protein